MDKSENLDRNYKVQIELYQPREKLFWFMVLQTLICKYQYISVGGFPGGAVVESLPANAGDTGSSPGLGSIPRAAEQLGPWATVTEPARLEPVLRNGRGRDGERLAHRDEEWPPLAAARESPRTETKTQHSHKLKKKKKKKKRERERERKRADSWIRQIWLKT